MDRTDLRILDALQQDGRLSNQALADRIGVSTAACWRRVRALIALRELKLDTALSLPQDLACK